MSVDASARVWPRALAVVLVVGAVIAGALALGPAAHTAPQASAAPGLSGRAFGVELCPQSLCGAATFVGAFDGDIEGRRGGGWWVIAVRHDDLPDSGMSAAVTGGRWMLSSRGERTAGAVTGGSIRNNGDHTFAITVTLAAKAEGVAGAAGTGTLTFSGTLDHRMLPPTARGAIAPG